MSNASMHSAPAPQATVDPVTQIEAAAARITATQVTRSELQFQQAFLALRLRDYISARDEIARTHRRLQDQSRALQAQLPDVYRPRSVAQVQEALRTHAREHGGEATARRLASSPESVGPLRGAPLTPTRQKAREIAREAGVRLSALHGTRQRLAELRGLSVSKEHLAGLEAELARVTHQLRQLPSIPALHHHLLRSLDRAGGLPAVAARLSPPTLALAEKAMSLGRSWVEGLSR